MSTRQDLTGFETRLLAELRQVVAERAVPGALPAAAPHPAAPHPAAPHPAAPGRPHRRLAMAGVLSTAVAGGLMVALTVTPSGNGSPPAGPPHFAAATTVAAVLDNAALAAQSEPAVIPRPDQFVYSKIVAVGPTYRDVTEYWISASGTRKGFVGSITPNGKKHGLTLPWCDHGVPHGALQRPCTPRDFAAYKPWLPSTAAGMRAFLVPEPSHADPRQDGLNLLDRAFLVLTGLDLTPSQRAATFRALAGVPHLHVVKGVTDALGRTGIGIASTYHGETWTTIFDPRTFKTLGAVVTKRGETRRWTWAVAVPTTVVDRVGQRR